jgi:antitoxin component of RelBE/YafQ-DinJ toxin-antitoxin module
MAGFLGKIKQKLSRTSSKLDKYQEAITFAEAGESDYAMETMAEQKEEHTPTKLLVLGRESAFSKEIIDYALEMAQRMSYEILALNTAPLSCETFKLFSSSRDQVCEEFKSMSKKSAEVFRELADEKGIPFDHVVMFSEPEEALEAINRENKDIAFVVSESVEDRTENIIEQGERLRRNVYVYSMV